MVGQVVNQTMVITEYTIPGWIVIAVPLVLLAGIMLWTLSRSRPRQ